MKKNKDNNLSSIQFNTFLKLLNYQPIIQKSLDWKDSLPKNLYNELIDMSYKQELSEIDLETYDNFEISTNIYKLGSNKYLGVRSITKVYSDYVEVEMYKYKLGFKEIIPYHNVRLWNLLNNKH